MGNLGFIGGTSSDDVIDELTREAEVGQGETIEGADVDGGLRRLSLSEQYQTPKQVLAGLIDAAHLFEDDEAIRSFARGLIEGASGSELYRFTKLVVGVNDLFRAALDPYRVERKKKFLEDVRDDKPGAVDISMDRLKYKIDDVLREGNPDAEEFVGETEGLLSNFDDIIGDLDLDWLAGRIAVFKYEIEKRLLKRSGIEF